MTRLHSVSIVQCAPTADEAEVLRRTREAIDGCGGIDAHLRAACKIAVKINAGVDRIILTDGKQTELTEPAVAEAVIAALRDATDAEIIVGDATTGGDSAALYARLGYPERLARYRNVRLIDFNQGERVLTPMRHDFAMFRSYWAPRELVEADAFVSVAKMKAHGGMGCTLSIKNLFGWLPTDIYGRPRSYLHDRLIRLPRVLVDLAAWMRPALNVVDGIVAANKSEWGGTPMRPGVILAGSNCVATDSVGAQVMGFDPTGDYPDHPFFYRRNAIRLAAEYGLGPATPEEIEVVGAPVEQVRQEFHVERKSGDTQRNEQIRRGAQTVESYRAAQDDLANRYAGRYLAFKDGELLWDAPDVGSMQRRERESGRDWRDLPNFMIRCVPAGEETEQMDWYSAEAERLSGA